MSLFDVGLHQQRMSALMLLSRWVVQLPEGVKSAMPTVVIASIAVVDFSIAHVCRTASFCFGYKILVFSVITVDNVDVNVKGLRLISCPVRCHWSMCQYFRVGSVLVMWNCQVKQ